MAVTCSGKYTKEFLTEDDIASILPELETAHDKLIHQNGEGSDFLGWYHLPRDYDRAEFQRIKQAAAKIQKDSDVLIVIGIGGSYLGARAVIEFIKSQNYNLLPKQTPNLYFIGNSVSASAIADTLALCKGKRFSINVISKSGTTTEPAIAFRIFRELLEEQVGKQNAKERIYVTTDKARGTLKQFADEAGYETFVIPDNIGGRYSVLTACGLLPIAAAGVDIDALMEGAREACEAFANCDIDQNDAYRYAVLRNALYRKGKDIEILACYEPCFQYAAEWWKQLYGESEGKDGKGIFPSSVLYSTDLHSLGQIIQQGKRNLFETVVDIAAPKDIVTIPNDPVNMDQLNFLSGKTLDFVNKKAYLGTVFAHVDGGVPNLLIEVGSRTERDLGSLIYFFELACGISGYLLGVNPFNQPGVEFYKKNMFALLGKPGAENEVRRRELEARIQKNS